MKGFKKCCMSSTVAETDGDMLWNDSEEDGNVRSSCEEGTDGVSDTDWYREIESDMLCVFSVKLIVNFF